MGLRTAATIVSTIAGLGASGGTAAHLIVSSPGAQAVAPAGGGGGARSAADGGAPGQDVTSADGSASVASSVTASVTSPPSTGGADRCDDGPWHVAGAGVEGRPEAFDAGDRGATYVWHDGNGWHLRTTDVRRVDNVYTGTIALSRGARVTFLRPVRLESDDRLDVDGDNVIHYRFDTYNGIDGFDFRVSACDGDREREALAFHLLRDGEDDRLSRIDLGAERQHPDTDPFVAVRAL